MRRFRTAPHFIVLLCAATLMACNARRSSSAANEKPPATAAVAAGPAPTTRHAPKAAAQLGGRTGRAIATLATAAGKPGAPARLRDQPEAAHPGETPDKKSAPRAQPQDWSRIAPPQHPTRVRYAMGKAATGFSVNYAPSREPAFADIRAALHESRTFEDLAAQLNGAIALPRRVDVQVAECNEVNAVFDPPNHRIIVCYELIAHYANLFRDTYKDDTELANAVLGATAFAFLHEVGHALIFELELAAVGRQEDAADQLATLALFASGPHGPSVALAGAYWFGLQAASTQGDTPFWDEHAFDSQRFYNVLCMVYGADPKGQADLVGEEGLPQERASRCPEEFALIARAWNTLLQPHVTARGASYLGTSAAEEAGLADDGPGDGPAPTDNLAAGLAAAANAPQQRPPRPRTAEIPARTAAACADVLPHLAALVRADLAAQTQDMSPDDLAAAEAALESELPAVLETVNQQCQRDAWSPAALRCIARAKTIAAADACPPQ